MDLITQYCDEYLAKIFYFSLRKTGNESDAEELASDISFEILTSLSRGSAPREFSPWVWTVARNRWTKFARAKYYPSADQVPIDEAGELSDGSDIEEDVVLAEDLEHLRRELAFIRSDYRRILVAHYFEEKSVSAIAREFGIPPGTVKTKLVKARQQLKEGMNMARTFGKRSYSPEEISFVNNCTKFGNLGQPWTILGHLMYKNIFLETYGDPKTAEELSLELGIALPYMEAELKYLTDETFLRLENGKYEPTFPIISSEAQEKVHNLCRECTPRFTELYTSLVDTFLAACEKSGLPSVARFCGIPDAKWTLLMLVVDKTAYQTHSSELERRRDGFTPRPCDGEWDIVGYQHTDFDKPRFVGQHGWQYKFQYEGMLTKNPESLTAAQRELLRMIARGGSLVESEDLRYLESTGYLSHVGDEYVLTSVVIDRTVDGYRSSLLPEELEKLSLIAAEIARLEKELTKACDGVVCADVPDSVKNDPYQLTMAMRGVRSMRGYILEQALADGWITYDENTGKTVGSFIEL